MNCKLSPVYPECGETIHEGAEKREKNVSTSSALIPLKKKKILFLKID